MLQSGSNLGLPPIASAAKATPWWPASTGVRATWTRSAARCGSIFALGDLLSTVPARGRYAQGSHMIDGFAYTDTTDQRDRILPILRLLRPYAVAGATKVRLGRDHDGGYVMIDDFTNVAAAYSFGIKDDVSWDLQVAERGIDVFQYDHTIDRLPAAHPRFHWSRRGVCGDDEENGLLSSLSTLIHSNGHEAAELILKMDVEGAEWSVFSTIAPAVLDRFQQIVCEFHGLQHVGQDDFYKRMLISCRTLALTHRVVHVHANNNTAYAIVGGVPIPACIEVTFIRMRGRHLEPSVETFPTPLDQPCWPGRADYNLGRFEF